MTNKENQMIDPVAESRREYENADKAFCLNPTDANLAIYETKRKALLAAKTAAGISSNEAIDEEEDEDDRPFPDSDEDIRALQDIADEFDEVVAENHRLSSELKTAISERDEARCEVCESEKYCKEEAKKRGWDCFKKETP